MTEHDAVLCSWLCQECYALNNKEHTICTRCSKPKEPYLTVYVACNHCKLKLNGCDQNGCKK